jgi:hypothetical protein
MDPLLSDLKPSHVSRGCHCRFCLFSSNVVVFYSRWLWLEGTPRNVQLFFLWYLAGTQEQLDFCVMYCTEQ